MFLFYYDIFIMNEIMHISANTYVIEYRVLNKLVVTIKNNRYFTLWVHFDIGTFSMAWKYNAI
ncbi:hypothetical protein Deiofobo_0199 [Pseudomonas phage Deifobo]|nr:hypothetical protein Deiofobo_0199 [Pseudomonas phage Deifobo]